MNIKFTNIFFAITFALLLYVKAQDISSASISDGNRWGDNINVKDFGAIPDDMIDDTGAIVKAIQFAKSRLPATIYFPKGIYLYSSLGNLGISGLSIKGAGSQETILRYTGLGSAIYLDAFQLGASFVQRCNYQGLTIDGNSKANVGFNVQGLARSVWDDVWVRNILNDNTHGKAFFFKGVMLNTFKNIGFSTDLNQMNSTPYDGLYLTYGSRSLNGGGYENIGNSSNNTFISPYLEGVSIGIRIHGGDQNTFIGGASESNSIYGLAINTGSRFNTFIGTGFENTASIADIADAGISTKYTNIYSSKSVLLQSESRAIRIDGGFFHRIEVQSRALRNKIEDVTVNHWPASNGGFYDLGISTNAINIYNKSSNSFYN